MTAEREGAEVEAVLTAAHITANTWQSAARRLTEENRRLRAVLERIETLAATWEGDSIGTDRYCAAELRDALGDEVTP